MPDNIPWDRLQLSAEKFAQIMGHANQAAENFSLKMGPFLHQAMRDGYILAAERAGVQIIPGTLRMREYLWLRRPKSKKRRQWKKWQRLHAEKYLRVVDLTPAVC